MLHDSLTDLQVSVRNELTTLLCSTSVPPFKPPFPFFHRGHVVVHPLLHVLSLLSVLRAQAVVLRALTAAQSFVSSYRETQVWKNSYTFALVFQPVWLISSPSDLSLSLPLLGSRCLLCETDFLSKYFADGVKPPIIVEARYLNIDVCKSQKDEIIAQTSLSTKVYRKPRVFNVYS